MQCSETAQRDAARQKLELELGELKKEKVPLCHTNNNNNTINENNNNNSSSTVSEDSPETTFLFYCLSMTLQSGNAISFHNTMITVALFLPFTFSLLIFMPQSFVLVGHSNSTNNKKNKKEMCLSRG